MMPRHVLRALRRFAAICLPSNGNTSSLTVSGQPQGTAPPGGNATSLNVSGKPKGTASPCGNITSLTVSGLPKETALSSGNASSGTVPCPDRRSYRSGGPSHYGGLFAVASAALISGLMPLCHVQRHDTTEDYKRLEKYIGAGDYASFLAASQSHSLYKPTKNELIKNLDTGLAQVFVGDYGEGAKKLSKVGDISEDLYTKSISRQVFSVLTNDLALPYYGEDYEVTFAGNAAALAFAAGGNIESALVEVRRNEHRLTVMSDAYEGDDKYHDDAFCHYLAGMLYEVDGRMDDARISYTLADSVYGTRFFPSTPASLAEALKRVEEGRGYGTVLASAAFDEKEHPPPRPVIVCAFTGRGPVKDETVVRAHFTNDGIDHVVKLAIPVIRKRTGSIRSVRLKADGQSMILDSAADYSHIAENAFNDRRNFIYAKTLARVSARYLILKETKEKSVRKLKEKYEKAKEEHGEGSSEADTAWLKMKTASLGLDLLANELLEHADTRSSLLIPERAFCRMITLPPGNQTITLDFLDINGGVISSVTRTVAVESESEPVQIFTRLR